MSGIYELDAEFLFAKIRQKQTRARLRLFVKHFIRTLTGSLGLIFIVTEWNNMKRTEKYRKKRKESKQDKNQKRPKDNKYIRKDRRIRSTD